MQVKNSTSIPYDSFVYIENEVSMINFSVCNKNSEECIAVNDPTGTHFSASGVVIANSKFVPGRQYIMTAGHFCTALDMIDQSIVSAYEKEDKTVGKIEHAYVMSVNNDMGEKFSATVVGLDKIHDLCVLAINDSHLKIAEISTQDQVRGAEIYNLAAPLGSWQPGSVHRFAGYYSGNFSCANDDKSIHILCGLNDTIWSLYTLAATHGSSGSPIFSKENKLVGIVVAVINDFEQVVWAAKARDMKYLVDKVLEHEPKVGHQPRESAATD